MKKLKIIYHWLNWKLAWFTHPNTCGLEDHYRHIYFDKKYTNNGNK